jgi:transposase-like protein
VLETESVESWTWFLQNLHQVIGFPNGLIIHTDACKGLKTVVEDVFPRVEHRECMRHLAANVSKNKHKGKLIDNNLWLASLTCSLKKHGYHLSQMYKKPGVKDFMEKNHKKLWGRSKFNKVCKVDYMNNNLAECSNSWIRKIKGLHLVDLLDKIRLKIMTKFELCKRISTEKFVATK